MPQSKSTDPPSAPISYKIKVPEHLLFRLGDVAFLLRWRQYWLLSREFRVEVADVFGMTLWWEYNSQSFMHVNKTSMIQNIAETE